MVWKIDPRQAEKELVGAAAEIVKSGGVVVYPTETFYGLGGHPQLVAAIRRIYEIKGRDFTKPLPLIADGLASVRKAASEWTPVCERLAEAFWPGPLTMVLTARKPVPGPWETEHAVFLPPMLHAQTGKIAVRVSSHPVARALAEAAGGLLISTSANPTDSPPCIDLAEMAPSFLSMADGALDAGRLRGDLPSTIVDVSASPIRLVRAGCLPWERIREALGL